MTRAGDWADGPIEIVAPLIASGRRDATALLDVCLARIAADEAGPMPLNAVRCLDPTAPATAARLDTDRQGAPSLRPLHGIPLIVKDNIDVAGLPTTSGSPALAHAMPRRDALVVERLRAAGAVILGKANMAELSFEVRSRSALAGDVRNPFNRAVTSGGSSGGAAVAVAAGFAVAAVGTDTGGSIRNPAGFNGLVGVRPTHGLIDMAGIAPLSPSTDTVGPIARSVADAALLFAVMADVPLPTHSGDAAMMRVGVLRQFAGTDPSVDAALERALAALVAGGVDVVDPLTIDEALVPRAGRPHIVDAEFVAAFDAYLAGNFATGSVPGSVRELVGMGRHLPELTPSLHARLDPAMASATAIETIRADRRALAEALERLMAIHRLDAFAYPTSAVTPTSLAKPASGWAPELAAMTGWPAISIPAGRGSNGVPLGIDLLGASRTEATLFALGASIERRLGPRRLPPGL